MDTSTLSAPLNQADFYAMERVALSYLWSVVRGTDRYDDGRYRSALVILGYLEKHHAQAQAATGKILPATPRTDDPEVLFQQEVDQAANGRSDPGQV